MNLIKRIKNLWKYSHIPPTELLFLSMVDKVKGNTASEEIIPGRMAEIIKRNKAPVEEIING